MSTKVFYDGFFKVFLKVNGILQCKKSSMSCVVHKESLSVASDHLLLRDSLNRIPVSITEICQILVGSFHDFDPFSIDAATGYQ